MLFSSLDHVSRGDLGWHVPTWVSQTWTTQPTIGDLRVQAMAWSGLPQHGLMDVARPTASSLEQWGSDPHSLGCRHAAGLSAAEIEGS